MYETCKPREVYVASSLYIIKLYNFGVCALSSTRSLLPLSLAYIDRGSRDLHCSPNQQGSISQCWGDCDNRVAGHRPYSITEADQWPVCLYTLWYGRKPITGAYYMYVIHYYAIQIESITYNILLVLPNHCVDRPVMVHMLLCCRKCTPQLYTEFACSVKKFYRSRLMINIYCHCIHNTDSQWPVLSIIL